MKYKLVKKFENYKEREGTKNVGESLTDQSQTEECDIYACLKKYGITTLVNKTKAEEFMYLDNTNRNLSLDEAVRMRKSMEEYFYQQPARVRKVFGDSVDMFIEKYKNNEFGDFLTTGVLNEQMVAELTKGDENVKMEQNLHNTQGIPTDINKGNTGTLEGNNGSVRPSTQQE